MKRHQAKLLIFAFLLSIFLGTNSCSSLEKGIFESIQPNGYSDLLTTKIINDYRESKGLNKLEESNLAFLQSSDYDQYMKLISATGYDNFEKSQGKPKAELTSLNVVKSESFNYDNCSYLIDACINNSDINNK